jgi:hypothetical protein
VSNSVTKQDPIKYVCTAFVFNLLVGRHGGIVKGCRPFESSFIG